MMMRGLVVLWAVGVAAAATVAGDLNREDPVVVQQTIALQTAVVKGDLAAVRGLLAQVPPPPQVLGGHQSAAMIAAHHGHCDVLKLLLTASNNAHINLEQELGATALTHALQALESLETMDDTPDSSKVARLLCVVRTLLRYNADPRIGIADRQRPALLIAAMTRYPAAITTMARAMLPVVAKGNNKAKKEGTTVADVHHAMLPFATTVSEGPFESRTPLHAMVDLDTAYMRTCTVLFMAYHNDATAAAGGDADAVADVDESKGPRETAVLEMQSQRRMPPILGASWRAAAGNATDAGAAKNDDSLVYCDAAAVRAAVRDSAVAAISKVAAAVKGVVEKAAPAPAPAHAENAPTLDAPTPLADAIASAAKALTFALAQDPSRVVYDAAKELVETAFGVVCGVEEARVRVGVRPGAGRAGASSLVAAAANNDVARVTCVPRATGADAGAEAEGEKADAASAGGGREDVVVEAAAEGTCAGEAAPPAADPEFFEHIAVVGAADLTDERFYTDYYSRLRPVLIKGGAAAWGCTQLSIDSLLAKYGSHEVSVGTIPYADQYAMAAPRRMTVADYLARDSPHAVAAHDYAFDNSLHRKFGATLGGLYERYTGIPGRHNPPQFSVGRNGTGSPPHLHQDAVNGVCLGKKLWHFYPPPHAFLSVSPAAVYFENRRAARGLPTPLVAEQAAGDLLYVPHGWGHAVLNLAEATVAIAVEHHRLI